MNVSNRFMAVGGFMRKRGRREGRIMEERRKGEKRGEKKGRMMGGGGL